MYLSLVQYDMGLWDHLTAAVICVVAPVLAYSSRRISTEEIRFEPEDKIRLYHSNALLLVVFALVIITTWRIPGRNLSALGFNWPQWNGWVLMLVGVVIFFYIFDLFLQYGLQRWRKRTLEQRNATLTFVPENRGELLHFTFLALAAGVGEEIIFRGYLMHYVVYWAGNNQTGLLVALFFSSALFAFLHGYQGARSMLKIFFLAVLFAGIFILSQSLLIVILLHALIDVGSGWMGIYILKEIHQEESSRHKE